MKKINNKINFVFIILLLSVVTSINQGFQPLDQNIFEIPNSSAGEISIITPENITYSSPMSGYYPGTFGFENDQDGSVPDGWVDLSGSAGCTFDVQNSANNHQKVLRLDSTSTTYASQGAQVFENQVTGSVELWFQKTSGNTACGITLQGDKTTSVRINIDTENDGQFGLYNSGSWEYQTAGYADNEWFHLRIDFDCNNDLANLSINEVLYFENRAFFHDSNFVSNLTINTNTFRTGTFFIDAVGYSWDADYSIGDNLNEGLLLSYENSTTLDWQGYSLDGATNKTILGNATIPMPSNGPHDIQVFGNNTMSTIFESNIRYFSVNHLNIITPENITYTEPMRGYYPGSYGFENDETGSDPEEWNVIEGSGCHVEVLNEIDGHKNVIELFDTTDGASDLAVMDREFTPIKNFTIEAWLRFDGDSEYRYMLLFNNDSYSVGIAILYSTGGNFYDGNDNLLQTCNNNQWYHVRLEMECSTDTFSIWIDGVLRTDSGVIPVNFDYGVGILRFATRGWGSASDYWMYVDAVGLSWDPDYSIGDNLNEGLLLSYENSTTLDWMGYSLDGAMNRTILGNTTIPMPSEGSHNIQVHGNDTMSTTHKSDIRYFSVSTINIVTPENKTYTEPISGYYPGSYGFENDEIGEQPQDWVSSPEGDIQVISELDGHKNVVEIIDNNATDGWPGITQYSQFPRTHGTIEFWVRFDSTSEFLQFASRDTIDGQVVLNVRVEGGKWKYRDLAGTLLIIPNVADPVINTWTHVSIDFRCSSAPSYLGLGVDRFVISIDGMSSGELEVRQAGKLDYNWFGFTTDPATTMTTWVDAVGFSWDPAYSVGDNLNEGLLLSYENSTSLEWQGYSLDGATNKTILGNTTIPMPSNGPHDIQVFGNDTIGTMYEDIRHFTVDIPVIDLIKPENKTYTEPMSGYYPARYGFENELEGNIGTIIDYIDSASIDSSCELQIYDEFQGHLKVLRFHDGNTAGNVGAEHHFASTQTTGSIEWWWSTPVSGGNIMSYHFHEGILGTDIWGLDMEDGNFWDMEQNAIQSYVANQWYHNKIIFSTISDTYDWYIDGILRVDDGNFENPVDNIGSTHIKGGFTSTGTAFIDAIAHSWDEDYTVGDNLYEGLLLSYENYTTLDWMGYSLDGAANKTILGNTTIPFLNNGLHSIVLAGNDTVGNYYSSKLRYFTISASVPTISINSPLSAQYYGHTPPSFNLDLQGVNIDEMWYTLDDGITNITFASFTGIINQTEWDKFSHGAVTLTFYANDSFTGLGTNSVTFNKDLIAPTTSIHYTLYDLPNQILRSTPISFTASDNSESGVSIIQYKINNSAWIPYTGAITLTDYNLGPYTITYQSIDAVGNIETEISVEFELVTIPPPPPDLSFIIYIIIGAAAVLFGFIYMIVIRPKTAPKREIKKKERAEQERLKRRFVEQQRAEKRNLAQKRLEQQRLEREKTVRAQVERQRVNQERIERERQAKEWDRQRKIELEKQRRLEEERAIIEKIRKVMNVSTRLKMELLRDYLKMDEKLFNDKIFDWAEQFGFTIDGDYLNIKTENVSDFIDELEMQFKGWRQSEEGRQDKI